MEKTSKLKTNPTQMTLKLTTSMPDKQPTQIWLWCWPETQTHEIVTAQTLRQAASLIRADRTKAIGQPYAGGPCPVCHSFNISPETNQQAQEKEQTRANINQFPGSRGQNNATQGHP